jgi:hypothetical protein
MSWNKLIIIFILALTAAVGIPLLIRYGGPYIFPKGDNKSTQSIRPVLPVHPANKAVTAITILYTFKGTLTEVEKGASKFEIKTDIKAKNLPEFIITGGTVISQNIEGTIYPGSPGKVSKGKPVTIEAEYNAKKNSWKTNRITMTEKVSEPNPEPEGPGSSSTIQTEK